jgi:glutathione S-transferase
VAQYWNEAVPAHLTNLEALCGETGFTASGRTAGEIYLWGILYQMSLMKGDFLTAFPKLAAWFAAVGGDAATKKVCEGKSAIGELSEYFVNNPAK